MKSTSVRRLGTVVAATVLAVGFVLPASAASGPFEVVTSPEEAFEFNTAQHIATPSSFGVVTSMNFLGRFTLTPDLVSYDPTQSPPAKIRAAGALEDVHYLASTGDPVDLDFLVSKENAETLSAQLQTGKLVPGTYMSLSFRVYSVASAKGMLQAYESLAPAHNATLDARIAKRTPGVGPDINVDTTPLHVNGSPVSLYHVSMQILPDGPSGATLVQTLVNTAGGRQVLTYPWPTYP